MGNFQKVGEVCEQNRGLWGGRAGYKTMDPDRHTHQFREVRVASKHTISIRQHLCLDIGLCGSRGGDAKSITREGRVGGRVKEGCLLSRAVPGCELKQ